MAKIYYEEDVDISILKNKTFAIIGYGSQGRAQALNPRDSGYEVLVGLRKESKSRISAGADKIKVLLVGEAAERADIIILQVPDEDQVSIYENEIRPNLKAGNGLAFSHGFNIVWTVIARMKKTKAQKEIIAAL